MIAMVGIVSPVGAFAVGVATVATHDNYSQYQEHSQYSDADAMSEIKQLEEKVKSEENALARLRRDLKLAQKENIDLLRCDEILSEIIDSKGENVTREELLSELDKKLAKELQLDQEELKKIDGAIMLINGLRLGRKG